MKQRGILFISILMIFILALAGCGGGSNSPGGSGGSGTISGYLYYDDVSKFVKISDSATPSGSSVRQSGLTNKAASIVPASGGQVTLKGTSYTGAVGSDGHFVINNVPSGDYEMTVDYNSAAHVVKAQCISGFLGDGLS